MIHSSIEIAAPPELVRKILLDFPNIPKWHSGFVQEIRKDDPLKTLEQGDGISGTMGGVSFTAWILEYTPQKLSWTGPKVLGLFAGIHDFGFEPSKKIDGGTTFVQEESYVGILWWIFMPWLPMGWLVKGYFDGFGRDMKREAERQVAETAAH
ncbi:hypothetical protein LSUE1_G001461 [Lachnellula suecica]|uniref:Uncharacterized protein n=1 Tax=Lachnellula suecica TaxID=602035 RepID=A0A8T9CDP5_9HELO|nr:hypothetical protein LSUE1_G001461 [Lachnellula suecica]